MSKDPFLELINEQRLRMIIEDNSQKVIEGMDLPDDREEFERQVFILKLKHGKTIDEKIIMRLYDEKKQNTFYYARIKEELEKLRDLIG